MPSFLVVGLCAAWCGTCREFEATFAAVRALHPEARFVWIDIEDRADIAGDLDIENFPSLAVFRDGQPLFFGVSTPQEGVVARLIEGLLAGGRTVAVPEEVHALYAALAAEAASE